MLVKRQVDEEADPSSTAFPHHPTQSDPNHSLAKRVSAKLEDGDYGGAVRIACSEESIADITEETITLLKEKHPAPHSESSIPNPPQPDDVHPLPEVSEEVTTGAIQTFPCGSAAGPDCIRPQHLVDLTSASAERGGKYLFRALAEFAKFILRGDLPESIKQVFFGATLIPLHKKGGGVRPVAVGQTLRRLVAKCVASQVTHSLGMELAPQQLWCGVPLGCETAAHASRLFLQNMTSTHLLLKLDFKNAFN